MARDFYHSAARTALEKDGWLITNDPLELTFKEVNLEVDLAAERLIAAERNAERIAVEIKSFLGKSAISEFHTALGQYLNYRAALAELQPERQLYLGIPSDAYHSFFQLSFTRDAVRTHRIALIVYNPTTEVIETWQKN